MPNFTGLQTAGQRVQRLLGGGQTIGEAFDLSAKGGKLGLLVGFLRIGALALEGSVGGL